MDDEDDDNGSDNADSNYTTTSQINNMTTQIHLPRGLHNFNNHSNSKNVESTTTATKPIAKQPNKARRGSDRAASISHDYM